MTASEVEELKQQVEELQFGLQTVEDDLEMKTQEADSLREEVEKKEATIRTIQEELERNKRDNALQEELLSLKQEESKQLKAGIREAYRLAFQSDESKDYQEMLKEIYQELQHARDKEKKETTTQQEEDNATRHELITAKQHISEKEAIILNQKNDLKQLERRIVELESVLKEKEEALSGLSATLESNDSELESNKARIVELESVLKEKEEALSGVSTFLPDVDSLVVAYSDLKSQCDFIQSRYSVLSDEYAVLLSCCSSLRDSLPSGIVDEIVEAYAVLVNELTNRVRDYELELSFWVEHFDLNRFKSLMKSEVEMKNEILVLQLRLNDMQFVAEKNQALQTALDAKETELSKLQSSLNESNNSVVSLRRQEKRQRKEVLKEIRKCVGGVDDNKKCGCVKTGEECALCKVKKGIVSLRNERDEVVMKYAKMKKLFAFSVVSCVMSCVMVLLAK